MFLRTSIKFIILLTCLNHIKSEEDKVYRPCPDKSCPRKHLACIRSYFAAHSNCSTDVPGVCDKLVAIEPMELELPFMNQTTSRTNERWFGLQNAYVDDLYVSPVSKNAVLKVIFLDLTFKADAVFLNHHIGREDTAVHTQPIEHYKSVITTTVIPNNCGLDFFNSRTYGYFPEMPTYALGKETEEKAKTDCETRELVRNLRANTYFGLLEAFVARSPMLIDIFLNIGICRFD